LIAIFPRANATRTGLPSSLLRCLTCNILALHLHAAFVFLSCIHSGISATFVDLVACPAFSLGPTAVPSVAASPTLSQATLIFSALFTTRNCQRWQYINCTALCQPHIAMLHSSVCSRYRSNKLQFWTLICHCTLSVMFVHCTDQCNYRI
jgi:hypothetical protein